METLVCAQQVDSNVLVGGVKNVAVGNSVQKDHTVAHLKYKM